MKKIAVVLASLILAASAAFAENIADDPSFESGNLNTWTLDGSSSMCYAESNKDNARTGKWSYHYWNKTPFVSALTKTFKVPDGNYRVGVWAMGGGGDNELKFSAKSGSAPEASVIIINKGWKKWAFSSVEVPVTDGELTVTIRIDAKAGTWGNFDDLLIEKM